MSDRPNPFDELERMIERMNRQLESAVGAGTPAMTGTGSGTDLDLVDEGDAFVVTVDLPGYDDEEIDVRLDGTRLTIDAERTTEEESGNEEYIRRERRQQSVSRSVMLPEEVVESDVTATHRNGVLTVRLPKAASDGGGTAIEVE